MIDLAACAFESQFTGQTMARLQPEPGGDFTRWLDRALKEASSQGIAHLVVTVGAQDLERAAALTSLGFYVVDVGLVFSSTRWPGDVAEAQDGIRPGDARDIPAVLVACSKVFQRSRFYADPFISAAQADTLHAQWIRNLFDHRADSTWVVEVDGVVQGFSAVRLSTPHDDGSVRGHIELVAVSPTVSGHGLGRSLVMASLSWLKNRCDEAEVKTQLSNIPACRLYERCGFALSRGDITLARTLSGAEISP